MKTCPFCAEEIQDAAIVCKHCGRDLAETPHRRDSTRTPPSARETLASATAPLTPTALRDAWSQPTTRVPGLLMILYLAGAMCAGAVYSWWAGYPLSTFISLSSYEDAQVAGRTSPRPVVNLMKMQAEELSLEYKLAAIDRRGAVTPTDPIVARYRGLLDKLSSKWMNTAKTIADATVAGQNSLREKGISESVLNIMNGVNEAPDTPYLNYRYGEHVAMYVTLRAHGRSHGAAVDGLSAALQELAPP